MIRKGSRYEKARSFVAAEGATEVFPGVRPREIGPATGVIEHTVRSGDRLDLLARHYYNDGRLWWRILDANPEILYGGDAERNTESDNGADGAGGTPEVESMVGRTIVIPRARE
jgi:nucleoid-associated protein YgaU